MRCNELVSNRVKILVSYDRSPLIISLDTKSTKSLLLALETYSSVQKKAHLTLASCSAHRTIGKEK